MTDIEVNLPSDAPLPDLDSTSTLTSAFGPIGPRIEALALKLVPILLAEVPDDAVILPAIQLAQWITDARRQLRTRARMQLHRDIRHL